MTDTRMKELELWRTLQNHDCLTGACYRTDTNPHGHMCDEECWGDFAPELREVIRQVEDTQRNQGSINRPDTLVISGDDWEVGDTFTIVIGTKRIVFSVLKCDEGESGVHPLVDN